MQNSPLNSTPSIGIFFGTEGGNTEAVAKQISEQLSACNVACCKNIAECETSELLNYDVILLGTSTWDIGDLQYNWEEKLEEIEQLDFTGIKVGLFGVGDAAGYPDTFVDGIGILWESMKEKGPKLIGAWSTKDYHFDDSKGLLNEDHFLGLVVDEDNESFLTAERVEQWSKQLVQELGLSDASSSAA